MKGSPALESPGGTNREAIEAATARVPGLIPDQAYPYVRRGRPTTAYRITDLSSESVAVAKYQTSATANIEDAVYSLLYPPLNPVRPYGVHSASTENMSWLITGEVSGCAFDPNELSHRIVLARHMARIHLKCSEVNSELANILPPDGPDQWRSRFESALLTLETGMTNRVMSVKSLSLLDFLRSVFHDVKGTLDSVVNSSIALPKTLTHGDLSDSNVIVLNNDLLNIDSYPAVAVIDWATARWGSPVADLAFIDLETYQLELSPQFPINDAVLHELQGFAFLMWIAYVIPGERETLASPWPDRSLTKLDWYANEIRTRGLA